MAVDIYNFYELVSAIFVFILIVFLTFKIGKILKLTINEIALIFCWHSFFALIFILVDLTGGHDAKNWYIYSDFTSLARSSFYGNAFMYVFSGALKFLKLNYIAQNLFFNFLGVITLFIIYAKVKQLCKYKVNKDLFTFFIIILMLPGLSFWSSGITKDTLSLFAFALMYYSLSDKINIYLLVLSIMILFFVRPFLIFFFFSGTYLYFFLDTIFSYKQKFTKKLINILIMVALTIPLVITVNFGFLYMSIAEVDIGGFNIITDIPQIFEIAFEFITRSQAYYTETDLGIPKDTFILYRYFYFLFAPISFQYEGIYTFIFTLENLTLLFIFIYMIINIKFNQNRISAPIKVFYLSIFLLFLILPLIFSNYGIALRYKWLVVPFILLAFLDLRKKIK